MSTTNGSASMKAASLLIEKKLTNIIERKKINKKKL